ncbi:MAG: ankyrin repeat domain-containing protein [Candidatus Omnitrophica bacterium]|nr:ankyrin repeat domain-containing protein [Candidatus Omnitrophota bacterium]
MEVLLLSIAFVYAETAEEYFKRGYDSFKQGNSDQVISDYTKAIEINPNYAEAYCKRGISYQCQGNEKQAISDYTKAIEINPNYAEAYGSRAMAYDSMQEYGKAWSDVQKAEELGYKFYPNNIERLKYKLEQNNYSDVSSNENQLYAVEDQAEQLRQQYGSSVAVEEVLPPEALIKGDVERVARDIANGADVNKVFGSSTPLCLAVTFAQKEMVKLLLLHGANPNLKDESSDGLTALHKACSNIDKPGEEEIVDLLITNGADVNARDFSGATPLIYLISHGKGNNKIAELLIKNGADVNSMGSDGCTPLSSAVGNKDKSMVELLIKKGANVNESNSYGSSLLMTASIGAMIDGDTEIVNLLISAGVDVNAKDNKGQTVLTQLEELLSHSKLPQLDKLISVLKAHGATH